MFALPKIRYNQGKFTAINQIYYKHTYFPFLDDARGVVVNAFFRVVPRTVNLSDYLY